MVVGKFFCEGLNGFFGEVGDVGRVAGPGVLDGHVPTEEGGGGVGGAVDGDGILGEVEVFS